MDCRPLDGIGENIGESLSEILAVFSKQTFKNSYPEFQRPTLEFNCRNEDIAKICFTILFNASRNTTRGLPGLSDYEVWRYMKKIFLLSFRKQDKINQKIERTYLTEVSEKIKDYLANISSSWIPNDTEASDILISRADKSSNVLTVFEHEYVGVDMTSIFDHFMRIQNCEFEFDCTILKGKILVRCSQQNLNEVTKTLNDIALKFKF